jgi:hypothetical protein
MKVSFDVVSKNVVLEDVVALGEERNRMAVI